MVVKVRQRFIVFLTGREIEELDVLCTLKFLLLFFVTTVFSVVAYIESAAPKKSKYVREIKFNIVLIL